MLPPHPWDDDAHRRRIYEAFDKWFIAYESRAYRQEQRWRVELKRRYLDAQLRRATMDPTFNAAALVERGEDVVV